MKPLRFSIGSFALAAAVAIAIVLVGDPAMARADGYPAPGYGAGYNQQCPPSTFARYLSQSGRVPLFSKPKLPVFQAAPWYNYWPYDGHFLTPAPISGQFHAPPMTGNFPVNPYFPGPSTGGGYGPMPGGPPPR